MRDLIATSPYVNVGLMTDRELYSLYLVATGYPKKKQGHCLENYNLSVLKRVHTLVDAHFYLLISFYGNVGILLTTAALLGLSFCFFNFAAGPFSLAAHLVNRYKDNILEPEPAFDQAQIGTEESLSVVATYLTKTLLRTAENALSRCDGELVVLDRQIFDAEALEDDLKQVGAKMQKGGLATICRGRLAEAQNTKLYLACKRDNLLVQRRMAEAQLEPIKLQLEELNFLASATSRLRSLRESISTDLNGSGEYFASVLAQAEVVQETLPQITRYVVARSSACAEAAAQS